MSEAGESYVLEGFLAIVLLVSLAANGLALAVFCSRPSLRTISNRFVINLVCGNLMCTCLLAPLLLLQLAGDPFTMAKGLSTALCSSAEFISAACTASAVLQVLLIAADQFMAVTDPLRYRAKLGHARSLLAILAQWIISASLGVYPAIFPSENSPWSFCKEANTTKSDEVLSATLIFNKTAAFVEEFFRNDERSDVNVYRLIHSVVYLTVIVLSLGAICLMNASISLAARKSARPPAPPPALISAKVQGNPVEGEISEESAGLLDTKKDSEGPVTKDAMLTRSVRSLLLDVSRPYPLPLCLKFTHEIPKKGLSHDDIYKIAALCNAPPSTGLKTVRSSPDLGCEVYKPTVTPQRCSSSSYMNSLRCRISNASLFRYREESRAARISVLVIILALLSQLPAAIAQAVPSLGITPLIALCTGSAISPFLFVFRSRRIKKEIFGMFSSSSYSSEDMTPLPASIRRTSSLSTERSWKTSSNNSSHAALRLLRALAAEGEDLNPHSKGSTPPSLLLGCPPGKSILKKVRAQSRRWSRRPQRCKFSQDSGIADVEAQLPLECGDSSSEPRTSLSSANSSHFGDSTMHG